MRSERQANRVTNRWVKRQRDRQKTCIKAAHYEKVSTGQKCYSKCTVHTQKKNNYLGIKSPTHNSHKIISIKTFVHLTVHLYKPHAPVQYNMSNDTEKKNQGSLKTQTVQEGEVDDSLHVFLIVVRSCQDQNQQTYMFNCQIIYSQ